MEVSTLIAQLASSEPVTRQKARASLVSRGGHDVTRAVAAELVDPRRHVRWEAAKALVEIADPIAAHALLLALEDKDQDVRWLAAEGLAALGETGLLTVLSGLTRRATSLEFCQGAHHVLHELKPKGHDEIMDRVLKALEASEPEVAAPVAAYDALVAIKQGA